MHATAWLEQAKRELGWSPKVSVREGLKRTIEYFHNELKDTGTFKPVGPLRVDGTSPLPAHWWGLHGRRVMRVLATVGLGHSKLSSNRPSTQ